MNLAWKMAILVACAAVWNGLACKKESRRSSTETAPAADVPKVDATLGLTGAGLGRPLTFTFEQLAGMKMSRLDKVLMRKSHEDNEMTAWQGPALAPLLEQAQLKPGPMNVTLVAADRYEIETELVRLKDAIVALKDGQGQWLVRGDDDCYLRFVPPHQPGNFWVMYLVRIEIEPVATEQPPK